MHLDNKGWGLGAMLGFCCCLGIALLIVIILVDQAFGDHVSKPSTNNKPNTNINNNQNNQGSSTTYAGLESEVVGATKKYQAKYYGSDLLENDQMVVTVSSLIKNGYLKELTDIKNTSIDCSGYGTFIKKGNDIEYHAYIKCGNNYTTEGYLPRLDSTN